MDFKNMMKALLATGVLASILVGCQPAATEATQTYSPDPLPKDVKDIDKGLGQNVNAGVPLAANLDSKRWLAMVASHHFSPRGDPFALEPDEIKYDKGQFAARYFETQRFGMMADAIPEPAPPDRRPEPQPYRRLSGVLIGDSILAIIDMGNGRTEIVRPGQRVPNSEWRVVSIDNDKAILHRDGTKLPTDIMVPLESKPVTAPTQPAVPQNGPPNFGGQLPPGARFPGAGQGGPGRPGQTDD